MSDFVAWAQIISTVVLVVVTAWYVNLTWGLLKAARDSTAPHVVVEFGVTGHDELEIIVTNVGGRPAQDVAFKFAREIIDWQDHRLSELGPFRHGIPYLPPGRSYRYELLLQQGATGGAPGRNVIDVTATWGHEKKTMSDRIVLDLAITEGMKFSTFTEPMAAVVDALRRIDRTLAPPIHERAWPRTETCPHCRESVKSGARKCPHCLEPIAVVNDLSTQHQPTGPGGDQPDPPAEPDEP